MKQKDSIEKAAELVKVRAIVKITGTDYWSRISRELSLDYEIRRDSCTCPSWQYKNAGREFQAPCVHQIAVFGSAMALFICEMRQTATVSELLGVVDRYAEAVKLALPEFRAMAEHEYQLATERVKDEPVADAEEELKYQPQDEVCAKKARACESAELKSRRKVGIEDGESYCKLHTECKRACLHRSDHGGGASFGG
jgi:hypothetical protein